MTVQRVWALLALVTCSNMVALVLMQSIVEKCECAAFTVNADEKVPESEEPLMSENPLNVTCDKEGIEKCQQICISLVQLGRERAPEILCGVLKHADPFQPSLWTRCGKTWSFSGLAWETKICCHDSLSIQCPTEENPVSHTHEI